MSVNGAFCHVENSHPDRIGDEMGRLRALRRLSILNTGPEPRFDHITGVVQQTLGVPASAISLIDEGRQWFKSRVGLSVAETPRCQSFCAHTIRQVDSMVVTDARLDPRFRTNPLVTGEPGIRSYLGHPVRLDDGYQVGALCAIDFTPRMFSDDDVKLLARLTRCVENELELRLEAMTDPLTGLMNRGAFFRRLRDTLADRVGTDTRAVLAVLDLDHFKAINDTYGHDAGDQVLQRVADAAQAALGNGAVMGRIGGEEFGLILHGQSDPLARLEAVRKAVRDLSFRDYPAITVSASIGATWLSPRHHDEVEAFREADGALYAAKNGGRNRIRSFDLAAGKPVPFGTLPFMRNLRQRDSETVQACIEGLPA